MLNENCVKIIEETIDVLRKNLLSLITMEVYRLKKITVTQDIDEYCISHHLAYDGGNHLEYNSNVFSAIQTIECVEPRENKVIVTTEDGDMQLNWLNIIDLITVADIVLFYKE